MIKEIIKYGEAEILYKNKEILSRKPKLYNLFWETTLRCNAKCKHCGSKAGEKGKAEDELTKEEIQKALLDISKKYNAEEILISVTGGEPLLREDVFEVMEYAHKLKYMWGMTTNGILIDEKVIEKMKKSGMNTISISIDGLEKTHDEFRNVKGSYKKIIENIKKIKEANFLEFLQVTTVINKTNLNELEKIYDEIKKINIDSWRILSIDPIGRAIENKELLLNPEEYKILLNFIKEKRKKEKFDISYGCSHFLGMKYEKETRSHMFFCTSGFSTASILYNGDIYVCPNVERRKELVQGNIRKENFVDVWENKFEIFRDFNNRKNKECEQCSDWKYCLGDSLHTWDFEKQKPKICMKKILEEN